MTDFRSVERILGFAVGDSKAMVEKLVVKPLDCHIRKSIDCRSEDRSAVMLEVLGEIATAAQKADTNRRLCDDHFRNFPTAAA